MEEKESSQSGSVGGNSDNGSPPAPIFGMSQQALAGDRSFGAVLTTVTAAMTTSSISATVQRGSGSGDFPGKKKRGRPRKYDAAGNLMFPATGFWASSSSSRRPVGRPRGSGNDFRKTAAGDFMPHIVTVNAGQGVTEKLESIFEKGSRAISVMSANGTVSSVTIRQPGSSDGSLTYEGRFEILSLSGSFSVVETGGSKVMTGRLSVSLAGPDGRVIGGALAGPLTAASPIQLVVGSYKPNAYQARTYKPNAHQANRKRQLSEQDALPSPVPAPLTNTTTVTPITQAKPDTDVDSSAGDATSERHNQNFPSPNVASGWNGTKPVPAPLTNITTATPFTQAKPDNDMDTPDGEATSKRHNLNFPSYNAAAAWYETEPPEERPSTEINESESYSEE